MNADGNLNLNARRAQHEFRMVGLNNARPMFDILRGLSVRSGMASMLATADTLLNVIDNSVDADREYGAALVAGDYNPDVEKALERLYRLVDREAEFLEWVKVTERV